MPQHRLAFDCTPAELLESSLECHYCRRIVDGIQQFPKEIGDFIDTVTRIYARGPADERPHTLTLEVYFRKSQSKLELEFYTHNEDGLPAAKGAIRHKRQTFQPAHSMCEENIAWALTSIEKCLKDHSMCAERDKPLLPTRVLSISRSIEGNLQVKLQETKGMRGRYACLSHRWGGSGTGTTRQESYAQKLNDIPWTTIPKTFQHAIKFAHALRIDYLWIDSYCIIQDIAADWDAESKRMASIFENSYLTIAATAAVDNEAGCFWDDDVAYGRHLIDEESLPADLRCLSIQKVMHHWERTWTSNREARFPLLTRAWVFQERLLAPRVLHFSHKELVWECAGCGDCQCGNFDNRSNAKTASWKTKSSWHTAVELYTSLKLSKETDRLAAFHGFAVLYARIVVAKVERDYFAGLWKDSLHLDLLWRVESLLTVEKDSPYLCRCWDTEITAEQNFQWCCQYSYSAACSKKCLTRRRLCRYGKESAAKGLFADIEGLSCVDQHPEKTNVTELHSHEGLHPNIHQQRLPMFPSWSWASARRGVTYWTDIAYGTRRDNERGTCRFFTKEVSRSDKKNVTGKVGKMGKVEKPITLRAEGYIVPALLHYKSNPIFESLDDQHDSEEKKLRCMLSHNEMKYGLQLQYGSMDLDFHPDWIFSLDGPKFIPNRTQLFLFHITGNVYLVLKEKWFFGLQCSERVRHSHHMRDDLKRKLNGKKRESHEHTHAPEGDLVDDEEATGHAQEASKAKQRPPQTSNSEGSQMNTSRLRGAVDASEGHQIASGVERRQSVSKPPTRPSSTPDRSQFQLAERPRKLPTSDNDDAFLRVGILRVPWRQADSLHHESHRIDEIQIE